ncbi:hypothetical protein GXP70_12440 [Paenibacillus lycopersici]|uniref:Uncharacterized protein n=1 Tax=Paenibacillus lycopersici TaxID=2704462 RepID=A0A6C0G0E8_9BACL|nr:hypothetical protein [Paenibacillus lycopersici]QHT60669.1 hypothetical protein GXP70_12440 [Paenibacillus lycopersici]
MAKFSSRCPNQVLCMVPARNSIVDGILVPVPGQNIRFEHGEYETNSKKEVDFIRAHRLFGNAIIEVKGGESAPAPQAAAAE